MDFSIQHLYDYCQHKYGVTEHFPFDEDTLVFKVGGKMFCLTSLSDWERGQPTLNLKCVPERALELRADYAGVQPGYHMNKQHWNTVSVGGDVPYPLLLQLIDHSYALVWQSLPAKLRSTWPEPPAL